MSFNQKKFALIGAHSSDTPSSYSYQSTDTIAVIVADDYFEDKKNQLREGDWIFAVASDGSALLQVSSERSTASLSQLVIGSPAFAEYHLTTTPEVVALNDDGITYTPIPNMVLNVGRLFTVSSGILNYEGETCLFLVNGTSDLEVNKASDVTYALVIDGVPVPSELTTVSFTAAGKKRNISITAIAQIQKGQTIEIWAKGDGTASLSITINKLDTTFLRVC